MTLQQTDDIAFKSPGEPDTGTPTMADQILVHPLFNNEGLLATPPINEIFLMIRQAIILSDTGWVFTGPSGIGKTFAINMVRAMLELQYPRLCMFTHDSHNHQIPSIRAFFKHFLSTVGHKDQRGETYDLRARLVSILIDEARISGINKVVMFIDEASAMLLTDFLFLKDVHNDLARGHVQLITVLMGQSPDMDRVIFLLREKKRTDLLNRFVARVMPMRAYNKHTDLRMILAGIDSARFPHTGPTWTEFFLPRAFGAGFRLVNETLPFLEAIKSSGANTSGRLEFPARQTFLAIRHFLLSASSVDAETFELPAGIWGRAVAYAKLQDAIHQMAASKKSAKAKAKQTEETA